MEKIAIFDFGTSKIKILLCTKENNKINYELLFEEVLIGKLFNNNLNNEEKIIILKDFKNKTLYNIDKLKKQNYKILAIATEIFRTNNELYNIINNLNELYNLQLNIIDGDKEALLLAANFSLDKETLITDIGGGSSQLIYKTDTVISNSYPLGSYKIQSLFQPNNEIMNREIYNSINIYIKNIFKNNNKSFVKLIVGSNRMYSFFNNLSTISGINFLTNDYFNSELIEKLINELFIDQKYEDLFKYFPENPNFMYGADKMLILLKNYIDIFNIKYIYPTNCGITTGLAKQYFDILNII